MTAREAILLRSYGNHSSLTWIRRRTIVRSYWTDFTIQDAPPPADQENLDGDRKKGWLYTPPIGMLNGKGYIPPNGRLSSGYSLVVASGYGNDA
jgi:hypothetical protein